MNSPNFWKVALLSALVALLAVYYRKSNTYNLEKEIPNILKSLQKAEKKVKLIFTIYIEVIKTKYCFILTLLIKIFCLFFFFISY